MISYTYRLGALGFLSLDIDDATGNAGIKDIILALKWVKRNIIKFGGDPYKITIGGNSAGAVLVHYLLLSQKSTNLFQRAFLITGSATAYRFFARHSVENAMKLAEELNIFTKNKTEIVQKLRQLDPFTFIEVHDRMKKDDKRNSIRPYAPFVPCVEICTSHAIITEEPIEIIKRGLPQNVPILAGFNSEEGMKQLPTVIKNPELIKHINENFELSIPSDIEYPYGSRESIQLANSIKAFYFNNHNISVHGNMSNFIEYITDTMFFYSINSWIRNHKKNMDSNIVYYYKFDFDGELNWFKLKNNITKAGTSHADELGYMFVTDITKYRLSNADFRSKLVKEILLDLWTNFIKYG